MKLEHRKVGSQGTPFIILHGLYGSSDNWLSIAKALQADFQFYLVDQRNHGKSPHSDTFNYEVLTSDLLTFFETEKINKAVVLGHSMGGKTAMHFALQHPDLVEKLVIVDIAPKNYFYLSNLGASNDHLKIIENLLHLDLKSAKNRGEIDAQLAQTYTSKSLRQFLLKNITSTKGGGYQWRINLPALRNNLSEIMDGFSIFEAPRIDNQTIFIKGENSSYVMEEDMLKGRRLFPNSELVTIPKAGHWLHAEQPELLVKTLRYFLLD